MGNRRPAAGVLHRGVARFMPVQCPRSSGGGERGAPLERECASVTRTAMVQYEAWSFGKWVSEAPRRY